MSEIAATKSHLTAQLVELEARRHRLSDALSEPLSPDSSEQAVELEDDDPLPGEAAVVAEEIAAVEGALARIDAGTYGECVRCGNEISPKRLEARPEAALCIDCANQEQSAA